ncbi:DUF417 family protein [Klebsiella pneumoniae]|nr:DUF417 family protein [Klebsiella pneumoniae]
MSTYDKILRLTDTLIQQRGFLGFSYADLEKEIGIRKASIHHHFPGKTDPIISSTWLNILYILFGVHGGSYFLGVMETLTFLALIIGFFRPAAGVLGDIIVIVTGITTLSLLPQLGKIDSFIIKDVLLIGAGAVLLKHDLKRYLTIRA